MASLSGCGVIGNNTDPFSECLCIGRDSGNNFDSGRAKPRRGTEASLSRVCQPQLVHSNVLRGLPSHDHLVPAATGQTHCQMHIPQTHTLNSSSNEVCCGFIVRRKGTTLMGLHCTLRRAEVAISRVSGSCRCKVSTERAVCESMCLPLLHVL